jgi:membrane protein implicated in regulation of membrane protease activity
MWGFGLIIVAVVAAVLVSAAAPVGLVVAAPVALILVAAGLLALKRQREGGLRVKELRGEARRADRDAVDVEFTDRDRETLYER